ncbi:carotenoid biosynthesis protein, partial [Candidatus Thorarchaeota archaeon]
MKMESKLKLSTEDMFILIFGVAFFLASWLVVNVPIGESVTWVSALFIVILALPSFYYVLRWSGIKRGLVILGFFAVFPIIIEAIGISTGLPYGPFYYTDQMGFKILGLVPWSVAFAFAPLTLGSVTLANRFTSDARLAIPLSALLLVAVDLVLDPAAVVLSIWVWVNPGPYYGIPISNYTGWFITALVASVIMHLLTTRNVSTTADVPARVA